MLELDEENGSVVDKVEAQGIFVDGLGVGDVGNIVLRDRQYLSENGLIIIVLTLQKYTNEILAGLGQMYVLDERFKKNIDKHGDGTAEFVRDAIVVYCKKKKEITHCYLLFFLQ